MESRGAFLGVVLANDKRLACGKICLNLFFGKMQTVFVIDTDFFSVDILF